MYVITPAIRAAARKCGVEVRVSTTATKKLDALDKTGKKIRAFGGAGYPDFHVYLRTRGRKHAEQRRKAYWARHAKDASVKVSADGKLTAGWLAARILW